MVALSVASTSRRSYSRCNYKYKLIATLTPIKTFTSDEDAILAAFLKSLLLAWISSACMHATLPG